MSAQKEKFNFQWKHPIPVALLDQYKCAKSIGEIIEIESASLLAQLAKEDSKITDDNIPIQIETIANLLNVELTYTHSNSPFQATAKQVGRKFEVVGLQNNQHYYRQRFSLAHELGHILLRRWAGPLNYEEVFETKGKGNEEEILCDLFASVLLIPKQAIQPYLQRSGIITTNLVHDIAKDFKVSKSVALRRLAELKNCMLLFWDDVKHPKKKDSPQNERVVRMYRPTSYLSHFIPLYLTARDSRFLPNLIYDCFILHKSNFDRIKISGLGSLPSGYYNVHNIFFQLWSDQLIEEGLADRRQQFFNMATFIELDSHTSLSSKP